MAYTAGPDAQVARKPTNFPWILNSTYRGEDKGAYAVGGNCLVLTATGALKIGDAVFGSTAFTVDKGTAGGNQILRVGVVVGGIPRTTQAGTLEAFSRIGDIGVTATAAADPVLICNSGVAFVVADGAVTVWTPVKLSTGGTAGQVTAATAGTDAGKILGVALEAATGAGDIIRIMVDLG